ncbi:MAG: hypothetical protein BWY85_00649 [Firmicutes bacterium ADurb.Bin506]|jgi:hypothetical protein|nr:MAG: hypothetical protein BWY85_00649 [Firmicutes bacterium ADurb.Bin506]
MVYYPLYAAVTIWPAATTRRTKKKGEIRVTSRRSIRGLILLTLLVTAALMLSGCGTSITTPEARLDALESAIRRESPLSIAKCYANPYTVVHDGVPSQATREGLALSYALVFALSDGWSSFRIVNRRIYTYGSISYIECTFMADFDLGYLYSDVGFEMEWFGDTWLITKEITSTMGASASGSESETSSFPSWFSIK